MAVSWVFRRTWWAATLGGGVLVPVLLFSPSVRAVGQSFLDAFRLPRLVAIGLDERQMATLRDRLNRIQSRFELQSLIGDQVEVEEPAVRSAVFPSVPAAGRAADVTARTPTWLPAGAAVEEIRARAAGGRLRFRVDAKFANQVLDFLDLQDALLPQALDGQTIAVKFRGQVETTFTGNNRQQFSLIQAQLPEVTLPAGMSLHPFGYAYLRLLGLDPARAQEIAATTDWRSTLVFPVPVQAQALRQVIVRGQPAFLLTPQGRVVEDEPRKSRRWQRQGTGTTLVWTEGDQVFILSGALSEQDALTIAGALQ